ncbi:MULTISPECIES: hypothetical protein [unclassified Rhizobium]|uniref:hypothetical protein n=1 Tax=unclassified Rhizobium TaxID=2613769 RepID=UPI00160AC275|nr:MULTISPECIES: hypothetical protein [unclassified Rhizobium]MBB3386006.1 hypothetical protein [Rhizobium sp. BK098]MBB3617817.1 hypothetical protein [Rhizobium sp. BK609]MBB3683368.1 hypothetical protein [Rhizobium sp. BK612]
MEKPTNDNRPDVIDLTVAEFSWVISRAPSQQEREIRIPDGAILRRFRNGGFACWRNRQEWLHYHFERGGSFVSFIVIYATILFVQWMFS